MEPTAFSCIPVVRRSVVSPVDRPWVVVLLSVGAIVGAGSIAATVGSNGYSGTGTDHLPAVVDESRQPSLSWIDSDWRAVSGGADGPATPPTGLDDADERGVATASELGGVLREGTGGPIVALVVIACVGGVAVGLWAIWRWYRRYTSPVVIKTV